MDINNIKIKIVNLIKAGDIKFAEAVCKGFNLNIEDIILQLINDNIKDKKYYHSKSPTIINVYGKGSWYMRLTTSINITYSSIHNNFHFASSSFSNHGNIYADHATLKELVKSIIEYLNY